jgi:hypothetical protein
MITIIFLQDFQGVETGGVFYKLGQVVTLGDGIAQRLIADKRAKLVVTEQPEPAMAVMAEDEVTEPETIMTEVHPKRRGRK